MLWRAATVRSMTRRFAVSLLVWLGFLYLPVAAQPSIRREGALTYDGIPEATPELQATLRRYLWTFRPSLVGWSQEQGLLLAAGSPDDTFLKEIRQPGVGWEDALTVATALEGVPGSARPGYPGQYLLWRDDTQGAEFKQLYLLDIKAGSSRRLTDGKSHYSSYFWLDGQRIVCASDERNGRDSDIVLIDADRGRREWLTRRSGTFYPAGVMPNGRDLIVAEYRHKDDTRLHILELPRRRMRPLVSSQQQASRVHSPRFLSDGRMVYLSDRDSEFMRLRISDPSRGTDEPLLTLPWDVDMLSCDRRADRLVFTVNRHGRSYFYCWRPGRDAPRTLPIPSGIASNLRFSPDGQEIAFHLDTGHAPPTISSYNFATRKTRNWMQAKVAVGRPPKRVEPRLVKFPSHDGRELTAYLSLPPGSRQGRVPVLISVHGGPEAQHQPHYSGVEQFLTRELGVAVLSPNIRGSDGYGKSFRRLDDGPLRKNALEDVGSLLDWVEKQPELDSNRVAIQGGSYGGFIVLASLARYPDRFRAGVDQVGVSDLETFAKSLSATRRRFRTHEYGHETDPEQQAWMRELSPLHKADKIRTPLLVVHGANDPRVPIAQAEQIVRAVREQGTECWYLRADDEGHGFTRSYDNYLAETATMVQFLRRHLCH